MLWLAHGETVTIHLRQIEGEDSYGQPIEGWADVPSIAAIAPRSSTEATSPDRPVVIVGLTAYLPAGTVIGPRDEMTVRGERYAVEGDPGTWTSPLSGWAAGVEVALTRAEG